MATDYTREVARQIELLVKEQKETNRQMKEIWKIAELRRFDDLEPPPQGVVVQNMRGCVCINLKDYQKMKEERSDLE